MQLREKGTKGEPLGMGWDEAQAALRAGTHEVVSDEKRTDGAKQVGNEAGDGFDDMTRAELDEEAKKRGLDVSSARNKGDMIEALRAAPAA